MHVIKGMVQVLGTTYRVVRVELGSYEVVRILDESMVGSFSCAQTVEIQALSVTPSLMRQIASAAVQKGRTSWMGRAVVLPD